MPRRTTKADDLRLLLVALGMECVQQSLQTLVANNELIVSLRWHYPGRFNGCDLSAYCGHLGYDKVSG